MVEDIDYTAQQLLSEKGILPDDFYRQSLSNWVEAQQALSQEDREVNPLELARQLGVEF